MKIGDKVKATVFRPYNGHEATIHGEIVAISEDKKVIKVSDDFNRIIDFYDTDFGKTIFVQDDIMQRLTKRNDIGIAYMAIADTLSKEHQMIDGKKSLLEALYAMFQKLADYEDREEPKQTIKIEGVSSQACPICQRNVSWKYCPNCGQRLKYYGDIMKCSACKEYLKAQQICKKCSEIHGNSAISFWFKHEDVSVDTEINDGDCLYYSKKEVPKYISSYELEYNDQYEIGETRLTYKKWLQQKIEIYSEELEKIISLNK